MHTQNKDIKYTKSKHRDINNDSKEAKTSMYNSIKLLMIMSRGGLL